MHHTLHDQEMSQRHPWYWLSSVIRNNSHVQIRLNTTAQFSRYW